MSSNRLDEGTIAAGGRIDLPEAKGHLTAVQAAFRRKHLSKYLLRESNLAGDNPTTATSVGRDEEDLPAFQPRCMSDGVDFDGIFSMDPGLALPAANALMIPLSDAAADSCSACSFLMETSKANKFPTSDCRKMRPPSIRISKGYYHLGIGEVKPEADFLLYRVDTGYTNALQPVKFTSAAVSPLRLVGKKANLTRAKFWLKFCCDHHTSGCAKPYGGLSLASFQVIECESRALVDFSPAVESEGFATLSYVWGDATVDTTLDSRQLPRRLPLTVEDTLTVCQALGLRYLWIDRYCIPQGDADAKQHQIRNMNLIYQQSALTIIAAAGEDPEFGLPGVSKTRTTEQAERLGSHTVIAPRELWPRYRDFEESRWNSRGWTFQEGILSRRRLIFTTRQMYYECRNMHCEERLDIPLALMHTPDLSSRSERSRVPNILPLDGVGSDLKSFGKRVQEYLRRHLTYDSDILNAFQGIIAEFQSLQVPVKNIAGVPIYCLPGVSNTTGLVLGLSWKSIAPSGDNLGDRRKYPTRRPEFPSWSWLGWKMSRSDTSSDGVAFFFQPYHWISDLHWKNWLSPSNGLPSSRFKSLIEVSAALGSGKVCEWETAMDDVLGSLNTGDDKISHLRLRGWLFTLDLPTKYQHYIGVGNGWQVSAGKLSGWLDCQSPSPGSGIYRATCILMYRLQLDENKSRLGVLVVKLKGMGTGYERYGFITIKTSWPVASQLDPSNWSPSDLFPTIAPTSDVLGKFSYREISVF